MNVQSIIIVVIKWYKLLFCMCNCYKYKPIERLFYFIISSCGLEHIGFNLGSTDMN